MRRLIWLLPCAFAISSLPASAGERYTILFEKQGGLEESVSTSRTLVDGARYRIEPVREPGEAFTRVVISRDGGESEITLLLEDRTYHNVKKAPASPDPAWSLFGLLPVRGAERAVGRVELAADARPELEQVSGLAVRRHDLRLSYDIAIKLHSETVRGKVRMEASFWMAEDYTAPLPPMLRPKIQTGFPEIDSRLTAELAKLRGLPVKRRQTISAEGDQGTPPRSETFTATILAIQKAETTPALFQVPAGFRYEEPVFTGMGTPVNLPQR